MHREQADDAEDERAQEYPLVPRHVRRLEAVAGVAGDALSLRTPRPFAASGVPEYPRPSRTARIARDAVLDATGRSCRP